MNTVIVEGVGELFLPRRNTKCHLEKTTTRLPLYKRISICIPDYNNYNSMYHTLNFYLSSINNFLN